MSRGAFSKKLLGNFFFWLSIKERVANAHSLLHGRLRAARSRAGAGLRDFLLYREIGIADAAIGKRFAPLVVRLVCNAPADARWSVSACGDALALVGAGFAELDLVVCEAQRISSKALQSRFFRAHA